MIYLLKNLCECLQINKFAFSGGQDSIEKHRELGANLEVFGLSCMLLIEFILDNWYGNCYLLFNFVLS